MTNEDRLNVLDQEMRTIAAQLANLPVRIADGGGGGVADATVVGVLAVAVNPIGAATETTKGALAQAAQTLIDPNGNLPSNTKVWQLQSGAVQMYQVVLQMGGQFGQSVVAVYASPQIENGIIKTGSAFNMARIQIAANKLLQLKSIGGQLFVDVEPC